MAHKLWKDMTVKIDGAAGSVVTITSFVNQASIESAVDLLEDTALGDTARSYIEGLAGATVPLNGFLNSTTEGIFGPLVGVRTSITKTFSLGDGLKYHTGEVWVGEVAISGNVNTINTFSCTLTFDGAVTRTSVDIT